MAEQVTVTQAGPVLTIRMARPEKKNTPTRAMDGALAAALRAAAGDDALRVVLRAGGADFTAGHDIADFAAPEERRPDDPGAAFDVLDALPACPKPVVVAVRGNAVGIGTTMLPHCDVVVAAENARFVMPFSRLEHFQAERNRLATRKMRQNNELEPFLRLQARGNGSSAGARGPLLAAAGAPCRPRARRLVAAERRRLRGRRGRGGGACERAAPDDEVEPLALRMAAQPATLPPASLAGSKRLIRAPHAAALQAARHAERLAFRARLASAEAEAAFAAFLSRKG